MPSSAIYHHRLTIPPTAIDENNHLNNVEYVKLIQLVAIAHANHTTCAKETADIGATWIVRSHKIEYLRPAYEGEHIVIFTWIANIQRIRAQRKYKFFRPADNTTIATGETDWVFANAQTGRPQKIPPNIATTFEIISNEEEINRHINKILSSLGNS